MGAGFQIQRQRQEAITKTQNNMKQRYTQKELDEMHQLKKQGASYEEIATIFNRTPRSLQQKFPELRESEDERIRKELMNEICCLRASESKGSDRYESLTKMLAYLEKQKEPSWKPSEEQMEVLNKARRFIPYNCDILESLYEQLKKL